MAGGSQMVEEYLWLFPLAVVILCVVGFIFGGKCPKCKRYRALRATGKFKTHVERIGSGPTIYRLYRCRYCGHQKWIKYQPPRFPPATG